MNLGGFRIAGGNAAGRYIFAVAVTIVTLLLRGSLDTVLGAYVPYLAVLPAVILSAWWCGLRPPC